MSLVTLSKGKGRADFEEEKAVSSASSSATSSSDSDSSENDSDSDEEITQDFLDALLHTARQNIISNTQVVGDVDINAEEEVIHLGEEHTDPPLPSLDPGSLPAPYIILSESRKAGPSGLRDPDVQRAQKASASLAAPAAPAPPPEISAAGKTLTKKERKALKNQTAGPSWFDLPAPAEADLPRLYREVEALRLRNQLDPKRFYRKDEGEGKGIKGLPKHFAIGTILPTNMPFGTASGENLSRTQRKRTLVDELVDDAEAKSYAKKKFKELQTVRGARGRGTLAQKKALRKQKW